MEKAYGPYGGLYYDNWYACRMQGHRVPREEQQQNRRRDALWKVNYHCRNIYRQSTPWQEVKAEKSQ